MYIVDRFILAYSLRFQVVLSMTIIIIMICFLFSDDYVSNLLMFFNKLTSETRDNIIIIISFSNSFLFFFLLWSNNTVVLRLFESVLLTICFCIMKSSIVNDIISFSIVRKHIFYTIMNYENNLTDFLYNS